MKRIALLSLAALLAAALVLPVLSGCQKSDEGAKAVGTLDKIMAAKKLRVGMEAGYMPFEMRDKKGAIVGFDVDVANEMAKAMGVELELVNTAWDGIIPALLTDKFDIIMSGMTITQERNLKVNFVEPYIIIGQTIILSKKLEGKIKSYADLNDPIYTVTSKLGTTGEQAAKSMIPKATYKSYETEQEAAMEVLNGRADAFVYDLPYNARFYAEKGVGKCVLLDKPFTYEPLAWAVNKGDYDLVNWLNHFLVQIKGDGRYDAIYDKWINKAEWAKDVVE